MDEHGPNVRWALAALHPMCCCLCSATHSERWLSMYTLALMGTAVPPPRQLLHTMRPLPLQVLQPPAEPSLQRLHQQAT